MSVPYYPQSTITPFLGMSLIGMDEVLADNFILLDNYASSEAIHVNGAVVFGPNFNNTTPAAPGGSTNVTWQVDSNGNISAYITGGGGGSGTVTSFSAGNLNPLFTSSVATPTTVPALTFALNTQSAGTVFAGPATGGAVAPTFRALVTTDIPALPYAPTANPTFTGLITGVNLHLSGTFTDSTGSVGTSNQVLSSTVTGTAWVNAGAASSVPWSGITNATANLTLANAGFTTEFDQTSAVAWLWKNTTVATNLTTNASPLLEVAANYWTGAASAADVWTIGSSLAAGTNGTSTLNIGHSGSSGTPIVNLPTEASRLTFGGDTLAYFSGGMSGSLVASVYGAGGTFIIQGSGVSRGVFACANDQSFSITSSNPNSNGILYLSAGNTLPTYNTGIPLVSIGNGNIDWATTDAGTHIGLNIGGSFSTGVSSSPKFSWAPTAGSGSFICTLIQPKINQTGSSSGSYTALQIAPIETALLGTANKLIDCYAGVSGTTAVFSLDNAGNISLPTGGIKDSTGSLGSNTQILTSTGSKTLWANAPAGVGLVPLVTKSGNYQPAATDYVVIFTATATCTLNSALPAGTTFRIKFTAGTGTLTFTPTSGLIDGAASASFTLQYDSADFVFDGTNWNIF